MTFRFRRWPFDAVACKARIHLSVDVVHIESAAQFYPANGIRIDQNHCICNCVYLAMQNNGQLIYVLLCQVCAHNNVYPDSGDI